MNNTMAKEFIAVLDFGGQYNQLIARRIREAGVYSEVIPYNTPFSDYVSPSLKGIILTGGPNSVYAPGALRCSKEVFALGVPCLLYTSPLLKPRLLPRRMHTRFLKSMPTRAMRLFILGFLLKCLFHMVLCRWRLRNSPIPQSL